MRRLLLRSALVRSRSLLLAVLSILYSACGTSEADRNGFDDPSKPDKSDAGVSGPSGSPSGTFGNDAGDASPPPGNDDGCSAEAKRVYVVGANDNALYSFEPDKLKFTRIGVIDCGNVDPAFKNREPHSMAVDRDGTAWVNMGDPGSGRLFKVSTKDASCAASSYSSGSPWASVGMGFSSDSAGAEKDTLFLLSHSGAGIAKVDGTTMQVTPIGKPTGEFASKRGELTGSGEGKLYGFFFNATDKPMMLAEVDKSNGATTKVIDVQQTAPSAGVTSYAVSYWGGDFWFYYATGGAPSRVIRYKAATDKSQEVAMTDVGGFRITGAGVSTCAPTVPVIK